MWTIKKHIKKGDYIYALVPEHPHATKNGYVLLHRIVMENKIGRLLNDDEVVHHKDNNKKHNHEDNLEIKNSIKHLQDHMKERFPNGRKVIELICTECGSSFNRYANRVHPTPNQFCSRSCSGKHNGFKHKPS